MNYSSEDMIIIIEDFNKANYSSDEKYSIISKLSKKYVSDDFFEEDNLDIDLETLKDNDELNNLFYTLIEYVNDSKVSDYVYYINSEIIPVLKEKLNNSELSKDKYKIIKRLNKLEYVIDSLNNNTIKLEGNL